MCVLFSCFPFLYPKKWIPSLLSENRQIQSHESAVTCEIHGSLFSLVFRLVFLFLQQPQRFPQDLRRNDAHQTDIFQNADPF